MPVIDQEFDKKLADEIREAVTKVNSLTQDARKFGLTVTLHMDNYEQRIAVTQVRRITDL